MFLAIRELVHAKFRYVLIGVIMVLIAMLIFIISGLARGLSADNASAIQNLKADYVVVEKGVENRLTQSKLPMDKVEQVKQIDGVEAASMLSINMTSASEKDSEKKVDLAVFATKSDSKLMPEITIGKQINSENELVVDVSLKQEGVAVGDELKLAGFEHSFTVVGFTEGQRFSHTPVAYKLSGNTEGNVSAIAIDVNEDKIEAIKSKLSDQYEILTKEEVLKGIPGYAQEQASLNMMIIFLFVIGTFVLAVFFYVLTLQKTDQFGVLKALGTKTSYLMRNIITQVVFISVICIGVALGLTYGASELFPDDLPFALNLVNMLQFSSVLLAVIVLGSLLSLVQIVKVDPIRAIEGGAN